MEDLAGPPASADDLGASQVTQLAEGNRTHGFRFRDSDVQRAAAPPDPVGEHIAQVRAASTVDEFHDAIWPIFFWLSRHSGQRQKNSIV